MRLQGVCLVHRCRGRGVGNQTIWSLGWPPIVTSSPSPSVPRLRTRSPDASDADADAVPALVPCPALPALMCVCLCLSVCVSVSVCVCVPLWRRTEMRELGEPRPPVCAAVQRPSRSRPISNIQYPAYLISRCMVWSGSGLSLSSRRPRLAGPVYSLPGRSKDGDHACHPIERLRRASASRWRFREGSSRRPMVLDGGVPHFSSSSTPWLARKMTIYAAQLMTGVME